LMVKWHDLVVATDQTQPARSIFPSINTRTWRSQAFSRLAPANSKPTRRTNGRRAPIGYLAG
jgi:hypothetical protein